MSEAALLSGSGKQEETSFWHSGGSEVAPNVCGCSGVCGVSCSCSGILGLPGSPTSCASHPTEGLLSQLMRVTHRLSAVSNPELAFLLASASPTVIS